MSKMSELAYDIEQLYIEGHSPKGIASILKCPIDMVYDWIETEGLGQGAESSYDPFDTVNS